MDEVVTEFGGGKYEETKKRQPEKKSCGDGQNM